jgi:cytochrome c oxidase subunit 2
VTSPPSGSEPNHAVRILAIWAVLTLIGEGIVLLIRMPPGQQSLQGAGESGIITLMTQLAMPVFVGVVVYVLYAVVVFRQRGPELESGPPLKGNTAVQIAWVAATAAVVLSLAVFGTVELAKDTEVQAAPGAGSAGAAAQIATQHGALIVQVIGQQWYFTYRYPDYGAVETTHLVLPVNTPVELHVTSLDVLHSFWAYQLGVKADANPGVDNIFEVTPLQTGSFQVRCAELCGIWHGNMSDSEGRVVSQQDFVSWVNQQQQASADIQKFLPPYSPIYFPTPLVKGH